MNSTSSTCDKRSVSFSFNSAFQEVFAALFRRLFSDFVISKIDQMEKHLPANYNPADYPPVKMRNRKDSADLSETQRKRRSKNRLSNRRSTGINYSAETIEEALAMGPNGDYRQNTK